MILLDTSFGSSDQRNNVSDREDNNRRKKKLDREYVTSMRKQIAKAVDKDEKERLKQELRQYVQTMEGGNKGRRKREHDEMRRKQKIERMNQQEL